MKYFVYKTRDAFVYAGAAIVIIGMVASACMGLVRLGFWAFDRQLHSGPHDYCVGSSTSDKLVYYNGDKDHETKYSCTQWELVK